jgi:hypothetical protein
VDLAIATARHEISTRLETLQELAGVAFVKNIPLVVIEDPIKVETIVV